MQNNKSIPRSSGKSRVPYFDCARSICMLWIIGFWHMCSYLTIEIPYKTNVTSAATNGALACFMYISGYFLGKHKVSSRKDAALFYKKRLIRLYPLFVLSSVSLYLFHLIADVEFITSVRQLILTLTGLAVYTGQSPSTVWFISLLLSFYLITPLFLFAEKPLSRIVLSSLFMIFFTLLYGLTDTIDIRVLMLFPYYIAGLLTVSFVPKIEGIDATKFPAGIQSLIALVLFLTFSFWLGAENTVIARILCAAPFVWFVLSISKIICRHSLVRNVK